MQIIHVSGAPGTGKTTLGEKLSKFILVKDTDDFMDDQPIDNGQKWLNKLHLKIEEFIENHPNQNILFVGIMDIFVDGKLYIYEFNRSVKRILLNVPIEIALQRFYSRIVKLGDTESGFWNDIVNNRFNLAFPGSNDKIQEIKNVVKDHQKLGYELMTEEEITRYIQGINIQCYICNNQAKYTCCLNTQYCSELCQSLAWEEHKKIHKKQIEYIATGGIAGTTVHLILHSTGELENVKEKTKVQVNPETTHAIYLIADKSKFYPPSELKLPPGFDIPRYLYYYGDLVAKKSEVSELDFAFAKFFKKQSIHPIYVKVGETFDFKFGTSAINYPSIEVSDGLIIVSKIDMEYNDQPGGTNMSVLKIKARRAGVHKIIKTVKHPNGPTDVYETNVIAK